MSEEQETKAGGLEITPDQQLKGDEYKKNYVKAGKVVNVFINFETADNYAGGSDPGNKGDGSGDSKDIKEDDITGDKGPGGAGDPGNKGAGGAGDPGNKGAGGAGDPGTRGGGGSGDEDDRNCKTINIFINFESANNFSGGSGNPGTKADASDPGTKGDGSGDK